MLTVTEFKSRKFLYIGIGNGVELTNYQCSLMERYEKNLIVWLIKKNRKQFPRSDHTYSNPELLVQEINENYNIDYVFVSGSYQEQRKLKFDFNWKKEGF